LDEPAARVLRDNDLVLTPADQKLRAKNLIDRGLPLAARKIFENMQAQGGEHAFDIAYATFRARHYREASALLENLASRPGMAMARPLLAPAYSRSDQFDKAIELYRTMGSGSSEI